MDNDTYFMDCALLEAEKAYKLGEIPVGAVVVHNKKIIGRGYNTKECSKNSIQHAEIIAISNACKSLGNWRLCECELYVTMSPCLMCIGAINECRISRVICGFVSKNEQMFLFNNVKLTCGVQKEKCLLLMTNFFKNLRNK